MNSLRFNEVASLALFVFGENPTPSRRFLYKDETGKLLMLMHRDSRSVQWTEVPDDMRCHINGRNPIVSLVVPNPTENLEKEILRSRCPSFRSRVRELVGKELAGA